MLKKKKVQTQIALKMCQLRSAMRDITLFSGQAGRSGYEAGSFLQSDASGAEISHKETRSDGRLHALEWKTYKRAVLHMTATCNVSLVDVTQFDVR